MLKRKMKQMASLLCVVVMILGVFTGCGMQDTSSQLYGTWTVEYDAAETVIGAMGDEFADMKSELPIVISFTFAKDGTFQISADEAAFEKSFEQFLGDIKTYMTDKIYAQLEEEGITREEADEILQENYEMSVDDYMEQQMQSAFGDVSASSLLSGFFATGKYKAQGNKLYMVKEGEEFDMNLYDVYEVKDNKLTLSAPNDSVEKEIVGGLKYPLTLTKKVSKNKK